MEFIIFELETRHEIKRVEDEEIALEYMMLKDENGNRIYDYYSYDEEFNLQLLKRLKELQND